MFINSYCHFKNCQIFDISLPFTFPSKFPFPITCIFPIAAHINKNTKYQSSVFIHSNTFKQSEAIVLAENYLFSFVNCWCYKNFFTFSFWFLVLFNEFFRHFETWIKYASLVMRNYTCHLVCFLSERMKKKFMEDFLFSYSWSFWYTWLSSFKITI